MVRLTLLLHMFTGTVLMGICLVGVLVAEAGSGPSLIAAILLGQALGLPLAWVIARKLTRC